MLRRVELWHVAVPAAETAAVLTGEAGQAIAAGAAGSVVPVTLADLAFSLMILILMAVGVRNIPGLLEIALLQHLHMESSVRFAVTALSRYLIIVVGSVAAFTALGIGWSKVQWLVAAMTVGLGFGLQEIFANFVSGLILLFERPIRIGDIVTVGDTSGTVTRIQMRATTVTDFDRRELIVPNKEFITSRLINWTLTDPITRISIPVGVAYGADTDRARELLVEAARQCEHVLADPAPRAAFLGFGDNSLDLRVYFFIPRRDLYFDAMNQVNSAIAAAFHAAGIPIAFPQRDIHLDTLSPLSIRILPPEGTKS
jgi:potassium-dependent mechanosensitive channel